MENSTAFSKIFQNSWCSLLFIENTSSGFQDRGFNRETHTPRAPIARTKKISYITLEGKVFIALKTGILRLETLSLKKPKTITARAADGRISPTLIVSPYAFQILDVLFRLSDKELIEFRSASAFCNKYHLVQSRISRMMTALKAKTVGELKERVRRIELSWWNEAFTYPPAKRHLTPFTISSLTYKALNQPDYTILTEGVLRARRGPTDPAKIAGFLKDQVRTLWCEEKQLPALKRLIRAIPSESSELGSLVQIAVPKNGYKKEALVTVLEENSFSPWINKVFGPLNIFHVLFDLSYFDERTLEARNELLKKVMSES